MKQNSDDLYGLSLYNSHNCVHEIKGFQQFYTTSIKI